MWRKGTRIGIEGVPVVPECAETICTLGTREAAWPSG